VSLSPTPMSASAMIAFVTPIIMMPRIFTMDPR